MQELVQSFAVQDWVYLKLQPYVQFSVMPRAHQKLCFRYFNPYQIIDRVGQVAYHLAVPASSRIHLVVHVSQLRLAKDFKCPTAVPLPSELLEFSVPQCVLPQELATWEDRDALHQCYPFAAPAWGQVGLQGRGNVSK
jgi:hypothetical protein